MKKNHFEKFHSFLFLLIQLLFNLPAIKYNVKSSLIRLQSFTYTLILNPIGYHWPSAIEDWPTAQWRPSPQIAFSRGASQSALCACFLRKRKKKSTKKKNPVSILIPIQHIQFNAILRVLKSKQNTKKKDI